MVLAYTVGSNANPASACHSVHFYSDQVKLHKDRTNVLALLPGNKATFVVDSHFARWGEDTSCPFVALGMLTYRLKRQLEFLASESSLSPAHTVAALVL